ncbi:hypothetical protein HDV06_001258 [Boothiomyces sp. JEL0866]|nr:hypothetical protein HDV06_001258 [Boothiomyces sp. JEL0866]
MDGKLPVSIANLTLLTDLTLKGNSFSGPIPPEYGNLQHLTILSLDNNRLSGTIPDSIGRIPTLTTLSVHNNQLTGPLPPSLQNLNSSTTPQFNCDDSVRNYVQTVNITNNGGNGTGGSNPGNGNYGSISFTVIIAIIIAALICLAAGAGFYWYWKKLDETKAKQITRDDTDTTSIAVSEGTSVVHSESTAILSPFEQCKEFLAESGDKTKESRRTSRMSSYTQVPRFDSTQQQFDETPSRQPPILADFTVNNQNIPETTGRYHDSQPPILAANYSLLSYDYSNIQPPILLYDNGPIERVDTSSSQPPIILKKLPTARNHQ